METATQTLHRLTSYTPGRDWDVAIDDPRIVQDLEANDMARLPWFIKRYAQPLPRTPLPRELPATTEPAVAVLAAYALGASASGMTFLDSEVPALVGEPVDGLLFTCVGVPRYRNVPAGPPGSPSRVRRTTPAT